MMVGGSGAAWEDGVAEVKIQYPRVISVPVRGPARAIEDVLLTGPFPAALRWAIAERGLSLDRLGERLAGQGLHASVSTLSNWQRGVSRPRGPRGLRVIDALEDVLGVPGGSLRRLLDDPVRRGSPRPLVPGTSRSAADRMRAALGAAGAPGLAVLALQCDVTVYEHGWVSSVRKVVCARRNGVDRHVVLCHTGCGDLPEIRAGRDATLVREHRDPAASLAGAELRFAPLGRGETFALEYRITARSTDMYYGSWLDGAQRFDLTARFTPEARVRRVHRIWRLDRRSPHKDVAALRLLDGRLAHLADFDAAPGFHGVRWTR